MPFGPQTSLDLESLARAYAEGAKPSALMAEVERRIQRHADPALFIARPDPQGMARRLSELDGMDAEARSRLPLFGIPFVAKDNIDVAGMPTTAACREFSRVPSRSATVIERLEAAGAILVGKANLDQFATGLVGVRSPYGVPRNAFDPALIPGGSSSGSATSVAAGLASFSLGTDTAGSGRVPAGLNNLVGLKPTPGLVSTRGVLPACRTLDCVSVFALTVDDAWDVLQVLAGYDAEEAYSRDIPLGPVLAPQGDVVLGVPAAKDLHFFGDGDAAAAFAGHLETLREAGFIMREVDFEPLFAVARLLYEGPWVAERYAGIAEFIAAHPDALHPVTRAIIGPATSRGAVETFQAQYRLADLARRNAGVFDGIEALVVPTVPRNWTVAEVESDPIATNSALGTYTNFVNLLGWSALAVPMAFRGDGRPAGITFIAPGGHDHRLAALGLKVAGAAGRPMGATGIGAPTPRARPSEVPPGYVAVAVVGAHLAGMPLNCELTDRGGLLIGPATTAPDYRLYALAGGPPARPGLVRVDAGQGAAIAVEVWAMPVSEFGGFVAAVPAPLAIGTVRLGDGREVKGFLCEVAGLAGAADVTGFGGWRAYLAAK